MELHLEYHHDENYRITHDATDHWIGIVCDEAGNEVLEFQDQIVEAGFSAGLFLAGSACFLLSVPKHQRPRERARMLRDFARSLAPTR